MDREGCAAMTRKTYCGNLLWQSGLTLSAPVVNPPRRIPPKNRETPSRISVDYVIMSA